MNDEHSLTAEESLVLIGNLIIKTKENIAENSHLFLLWGWLLAAASIIKFLLESFALTRYSSSPFPILAVVGMVLTILYYSKKAEVRRNEYQSFYKTTLDDFDVLFSGHCIYKYPVSN